MILNPFDAFETLTFDTHGISLRAHLAFTCSGLTSGVLCFFPNISMSFLQLPDKVPPACTQDCPCRPPAPTLASFSLPCCFEQGFSLFPCCFLAFPSCCISPGISEPSHGEMASQAGQEPQACLEGERSPASKCFCLVPDTSLTGVRLLINSQLPYAFPSSRALALPLQIQAKKEKRWCSNALGCICPISCNGTYLAQETTTVIPPTR